MHEDSINNCTPKRSRHDAATMLADTRVFRIPYRYRTARNKRTNNCNHQSLMAPSHPRAEPHASRSQPRWIFESGYRASLLGWTGKSSRKWEKTASQMDAKTTLPARKNGSAKRTARIATDTSECDQSSKNTVSCAGSKPALANTTQSRSGKNAPIRSAQRGARGTLDLIAKAAAK